MNIYSMSYERLIAYAASELNADDSAKVGYHVNDCLQCATTVKNFRFVKSVLRSDDSQRPPALTVAQAVALFSYFRVGSLRNGFHNPWRLP